MNFSQLGELDKESHYFLIFSFSIWTILGSLLRKSVDEDLPSLICSVLTILFSLPKQIISIVQPFGMC